MKINEKKESVIFLSALLLILCSGLIYAFSEKKDIILDENRPAYLFPKLTKEDFLTGDFQDNFELALADQLPLANTSKVIYNSARGKLIDTSNRSFLKNQNGYLPYHGGFRYEDHIVIKGEKLQELEPKLNKRISNINSVVREHSDLNFYVYYIERDRDIDFETKTKNGYFDYLQQRLDIHRDQITKLAINSYEQYSKFYLKTDHHWNNEGYYKGYMDVIKMMKPFDELKEPSQSKCWPGFSGSKARARGVSGFVKEEICGYKFKLPPHDTYINGEQALYGKLNHLDDIEKLELDFPTYGGLFGGDNASVKFNYNQEDKENLLILGESFDNPIIEIIASHYNQTHAIDLRNYNEAPFLFDSFVEENNIDTVLFIGNLDFYLSDVFNLGGY